MTNFFEYPDAGSCEAQTYEEPVPGNYSTPKVPETEEENAAESSTVTNETEAQTSSENAETRLEVSEDIKVLNKPEVNSSHQENKKMPELSDAEQRETREQKKIDDTCNTELQRHNDLHQEQMPDADVSSTESASAKDTLNAVELASSELSLAKDILSTAEQPSTELPSTKDTLDAVDQPTSESPSANDTLSAVEQPFNEFPSAKDTLDAVEVPACEKTEIQDVNRENGLVSPSGTKLAEVGAPQLQEVDDGFRTAAKQLGVKTPSEQETKDFEDTETASPTASPVFTETTSDDLHPEEASMTDVPSTGSLGKETTSTIDLPTSEVTVISQTHGENSQVSDLHPEKEGSGTDMLSADSPVKEDLHTADLLTFEFTEISQTQSGLQLAEITGIDVHFTDSPVTEYLHTADLLPSEFTEGEDGQVSDVHLKETSANGVLSSDFPSDETISTAQLLKSEFAEISQGEDGQMLAAASDQLAETVEQQQLDKVKDDVLADAKPLKFETVVELEKEDFETTSPDVSLPLSTTAPKALETIDNDVDSVSVMPASNGGLDGVVSETADIGELGVVDLEERRRPVDEPSLVSVTEDENNAASAPAPEQFLDNEEHLDKLEFTVDAAAAAVADDDDGGGGGKMMSLESHPPSQSVLSARDVFIEQQVGECWS